MLLVLNDTRALCSGEDHLAISRERGGVPSRKGGGVVHQVQRGEGRSPLLPFNRNESGGWGPRLTPWILRNPPFAFENTMIAERNSEAAYSGSRIPGQYLQPEIIN